MLDFRGSIKRGKAENDLRGDCAHKDTQGRGGSRGNGGSPHREKLTGTRYRGLGVRRLIGCGSYVLVCGLSFLDLFASGKTDYLEDRFSLPMFLSELSNDEQSQQ